MTEKIHIGNGTFDNLVNNLCNKVRDSGVAYKSVVGIQRGGLKVSIPLAECLEVKHRSVKISFYDGEKKRDEPIVDLFDLDMQQLPFLICDDLIDSGVTIKYFIEKYNLQQGKDFDIAVVFWNKANEHGLKPTYYSEVKPDGWIIFPWEEDGL